MITENIDSKFDILELKIKKLVEAYHDAKQGLKECKNENEVLRKQLDLKNEELKNFQNQIKISKIAEIVTDNKKLAAEHKNKINEYIKEIEKGLAYLNKV